MTAYNVIGPAGEAFQSNGYWYQDYNVQDPYTGAQMVKRYVYTGNTWELCDNTTQNSSTTIDLTKNIPDTKAGISLRKNVVNLDKTFVNLKKSTGVDLGNHKARVAVVVDFSGSMRPLYKDGSVQDALTRLVPLALRFDDNGELDLWLFHNEYFRMDSMNLSNFDGYVDDVIMSAGLRFGGTKYAPVLTDLNTYYNVENPSSMPAFVVFITDGDNSDKAATNRIVRELSNTPIFIQFVGIGDDEFQYLNKLDDLSDRRYDNTGFIAVSDFSSWSDDELYKNLLEQYIDWLKATGLQR